MYSKHLGSILEHHSSPSFGVQVMRNLTAIRYGSKRSTLNKLYYVLYLGQKFVLQTSMVSNKTKKKKEKDMINSLVRLSNLSIL